MHKQPLMVNPQTLKISKIIPISTIVGMFFLMFIRYVLMCIFLSFPISFLFL
ncbi:hypothetical protein GIB67_002107 [Kingdonia uniflora]|uniref:Uncharacterized protein n=1 Tax=Kingdonia uniflora TaxID=39325 RepID=A0A7J7KWH4_9MAGN|nr:hypothetical protein GIB67_002107 [Kingdonia uniflora]